MPTTKTRLCTPWREAIQSREGLQRVCIATRGPWSHVGLARLVRSSPYTEPDMCGHGHIEVLCNRCYPKHPEKSMSLPVPKIDCYESDRALTTHSHNILDYGLMQCWNRVGFTTNPNPSGTLACPRQKNKTTEGPSRGRYTI